jgi:hypothetical protein
VLRLHHGAAARGSCGKSKRGAANGGKRGQSQLLIQVDDWIKKLAIAHQLRTQNERAIYHLMSRRSELLQPLSQCAPQKLSYSTIAGSAVDSLGGTDAAAVWSGGAGLIETIVN